MTQQSKPTERPPIVVVMGHVDHGKSTLLDHIRSENVVGGEAGGITQHTYAYEITHTGENGGGKRITFLDTPGHEAFALMRTRGAALADIAILVVAADDGVKTQTIEALNAIREQGLPFIVAINKTDKPEANVERVKQELAEQEVFVEGYGGNISVAEISAQTGDGVPELLDLILLTAELEQLTTNADKPAEGIVVEAHRDPKQGTSAVLVVRDGTLTPRMHIVADSASAPVRKIEDPATGKKMSEARSSTPVRITGFDKLPPVGAHFTSYASKKDAAKQASSTGANDASAPETPEQKESETPQTDIPIVIKADTYGTLEAVRAAAEATASEYARPVVMHAEVGPLSESDIRYLTGSKNGIALGFNVSADSAARDLAERHGVTIAHFSVVYNLSEWLATELERRRETVTTEETVGAAKIIRVFSRTKNKQVVGGRVTSGRLAVGNTVRILRRDHPIDTGTIVELQQQKSPVKEVTEENEFGALIEARHDIVGGDTIESVEKVEA